MGLIISVVAILMYINFKKTPERRYWVQNLSTATDTISSPSIADRVYLEDGNESGNESGYVSSHDLSHDYGIQNPVFEDIEAIPLREM